VLGPVKRRDHTQQICFFLQLRGAAKYVQTGGNQTLFDFCKLFAELKDAGVTVTGIQFGSHNSSGADLRWLDNFDNHEVF
jgi:hypothetical protein